jgi:hypothetical protein
MIALLLPGTAIGEGLRAIRQELFLTKQGLSKNTVACLAAS